MATQSIAYYEFIQQVYDVLKGEKREISFTNVELYSETGYPLAPTPSIYVQPLSNWGLRDNELIYAYPKKLFKEYLSKSDIDCEEFVISIQLKDSNIRKEFIFNKENISCFDLKILLSLDMHILTECISIHYFNLASQCEEVAPDDMNILKETIGSHNLSFTISDTYFNNESRIQSVNTSCFPSSSLPKFHTLNADIQELVREYGENRDKDRLLRRLGLLRKISCSPPLVYSLYLLFTQSPTSLPHRIAINEGIITTISLLSTTSNRLTISKFPQLWMHIEEHALTPDLQLTEIYEITFISKQTRENPRDDDTRRLLQALPPNQDTIVTWRNASFTYDRYSYAKIIIILDISHDMFKFTQDMTTFLEMIKPLVNFLTKSQCKYLLGAVLISNNHGMPNGFSEIEKPTTEYNLVLEELKSNIKKFKPTNFQSNQSNGIILNSLDYCINNYSSPKEELKTEIFLFTNGKASEKYFGPKKKSFEQRLQRSFCTVNTIILSNDLAHDLEKLSKFNEGVQVTYKSLSKAISDENKIPTPKNLVLKGLFSVCAQIEKSYTYKSLSSQLSGQLMTTEEFLENSEKDKDGYQKAMISQGTISNCLHILRKVTAYIKSPNPYCKLYPFRNEILKWIIFMQGPIRSPFEDSIFILELYFVEQYPHHPPKLRFLSSVYHPNVDKAGHICHPILIEDYSPSVSLRQILDAIHSMLAQPIISHAVRSKVLEITKQLYNKMANASYDILSLKEKTLSMIEQDFEIKAHDSAKHISHPQVFVCPLTRQLFNDPVMTPEGNTFEHQAILERIKSNHTDPLSTGNSPLRSSDLIPNHAIADAVFKYKEKIQLAVKSYWWEQDNGIPLI